MRAKFSAVAAVVTAVAMSAGVASAAAHEFSDSAPGGIKSHATTIQKFHTGGGVLECEEAAGTGTAAAKSVTQVIDVTYTKCNANGSKIVVNLGSGSGKSEPVEYEFSAEGTVKILKEITIEGSSTTGKGKEVCDVTVPGGQVLSTIKYENKAPNLLEITEVAGIESTGHGGSAASCKYATEKAGTYTGDSLVETTTGGTIAWS